MNIYKRTKLATDWKQETKTIWGKMLSLIFPVSNPDYEDRMHLVKEWLIEFDEDGNPWREIGIGEKGLPILAGPDDRNYGFWLDTNMKINDFGNNEIPKELFESNWNNFRKISSMKNSDR